VEHRFRHGSRPGDFKVNGEVRLSRGDILSNTGKSLPGGKWKLERAGVKYKVKEDYFCDYVSSEDGESGDDTEDDDDDGETGDDTECQRTMMTDFCCPT
jgi:hypothetical protein